LHVCVHCVTIWHDGNSVLHRVPNTKKHTPTPEKAIQLEDKQQREKERKMAAREESLMRKYNESIEHFRKMAAEMPKGSMEGEGDDVNDFLTHEDYDT